MTDQVEALERLAKLKADGVLTEEEFAAQKAKLLAGVTDAGTQSGASFGNRWAEAREKSRGVRRFFRWFFGFIGLAAALIGVYFLTRGSTLETAREQTNQVAASPAPVANDAVPAVPAQAATDTSSSPQYSQTTFVATADMLDHPPTWDEAQHAWLPDGNPTSVTLCANTPATIGNSASRAIDLNIVSSEGGDPERLGTVRVGKALSFTAAEHGKWTITDAKDDTPLFEYDVTSCPAGQGGQ